LRLGKPLPHRTRGGPRDPMDLGAPSARWSPRVGGGQWSGHTLATLEPSATLGPAARSTSACHLPEGPKGARGQALPWSTLIGPCDLWREAVIRLTQFPPPASSEPRTLILHKMPE